MPKYAWMPTRHTATRNGGQRNESASIIVPLPNAAVSASTLASNSEI